MRYGKDGLCRNNSFREYKVLGPSDMPRLTTILVERPDAAGPYGAKSCGELGVVPPVGATANAVFNAVGVQIVEAPITPEKVLEALRDGGGTAGSS